MRMVQWTVLLVMWMAIDLIDADDSPCSNGTTTTIGAGAMLVMAVYARRRTDRRCLRCRGALHRCGRDGAVARRWCYYRVDHHDAMVQRDRIANLADVAQLLVASARRMVRHWRAVRFQVQQQLRRWWFGTVRQTVAAARCRAGRFMFVAAAAGGASVHLDRRTTGDGIRCR
uniref:Putative secreted protein n=1 Tax=Anopheles triannulatus TaxID=58253 RepID=A0A2M4B295_9DIPT